MNLDGWPKVIAAAIGSLLFAVGLAPLVMAGFGDIVNVGDSLVPITNLAIVFVAAGAGLACYLAFRGGAALSRDWIRGVKWPLVLTGAFVLACLSLTIANTDRENNTSWRYAEKLETVSGVSKFRTREFGRYFARLGVGDPEILQGSLATIPISWSAWAAGGQSVLVVRVPGSDSASPLSLCEGDGQLTLAALDSGSIVADKRVPISTLCNQWRRIDVQYPRGVSALHLGFAGTDIAVDTELDVMLIGHEANFSWLASLFTLFSMTALLSIVFVISIKTRAGSETVSRSPSGKTWQRRCFIGGSILLFMVISNAFVYSYVAQERTIYTWDFSGYWMYARNVSEFLQGAERKSASRPQATSQAEDAVPGSGEPGLSMPDPSAVAALIRNLRFAEYNISSNLPVAPVLAVFDGSRMAYELSLLNIYALAAVIMLLIALYGMGCNSSDRWVAWWPLVAVATIFCVIPFWIPILRGYMGISVVALDLAVLWLYFRRPVEQTGTFALISMGVLLLASVILQRWNAYWVVAFIVFAAADGIAVLVRRRAFSFSALIPTFRVPIVAGFTAFFLFAVIAWPKVITTVSTDYADIYSAYLEDDSLGQALVRFVNAFGGGLIALILAAWVYLLFEKKMRRVALLLALQLVVMFIHFSGTQTFGPHQMYILMPGLIIILCLALIRSLSSTSKNTRIAGACTSLLVLLSGYASGMAVFAPAGPPHLLPDSIRLLSQSYRPPLVRNDLGEFVRLAGYIDANLEPDAEIYVAAGSQTLNAAHFKNLGPSAGITFDAAGRILSPAVIDKRDGFPREVFAAQMVITTNPVQFSRDPSDQHVIRIPAESLMKSEGIGAAFEQLPETFQLDGGVEVLIFRRTRQNTAEEMLDLSNKLKVFYPDRPDVYQ
jgi:hypothetical protein